MWFLLLAPVFLYLAICAALYIGQTAILFPAAQVGPPDPLPERAGRLELASASGERLNGVHIPPARPAGERLLLLGFAGNGWNAQSAAIFIAGLAPEADVVVFHYRGYAPSEGRPSAKALLADSPLIHDFAVGRLRPARTIAVGLSIGTGVAASLASRRRLDGLILVTPFDSLELVAAGRYPWLPVRPLFRHRMDNVANLAGNRTPVAIIGAELDRVIPPGRTQALRDAAPNLVFDRTMSGVGHNDLYHGPAFAAAFREALASLRSPPEFATCSPGTKIVHDRH